MTLASAVLTLALLACAATLSIGGQLIKHSPRRTPFCRGAFFLSIVIGALAIMIPVTARSGSQALLLAAPLGGAADEPPSGRHRPLPGAEQRIPPGQSMPGEMGQNDGHRRDTALSQVSATGHPKWSLIVERAERLRSQGDYAHAADAYAEVLVSAGGHLEARLGLAQVLLEFGRYKEAELHLGRASAIARQGAARPSSLALALSAVAEIRAEFASRLSGPLTAIQRQRLDASEQARLTAIHKASPWRITINVTDVREELGELIVEGTLTTDPALRISVHSEDRSHVQRSIGEQLAMTIVLTRWPSGPEAFDAREVSPGSSVSPVIGSRHGPLGPNPSGQARSLP